LDGFFIDFLTLTGNEHAGRGERSGFRQALLDADRAGERCNASTGLRADSRRLHQIKDHPCGGFLFGGLW
jgi:hypothetical protein